MGEDLPSESDHTRLQPVLDRALAGDVAVWGELLQAFRPQLKSRASQWLGANVLQGDGSDIVQMVFEQALRDRGQFRGKTIAEFTAWLFAIEQHTLVGHRKFHRRQKRDERRAEQGSAPLQDVPDHQTSPSQRAIKGEQRRRLREAIEQLDDRYRAVMQLQFLDGLTQREVADVLSLTPGMVAQKSREGMKLIKQFLGIQ